MKRIAIIFICLTCLLIGTCIPVVADAHEEQSYPLKIWAQNKNGSLQTCVVVDDNTGVNYVVVTAMTHSNAKTIAITPRLNADGSLYVTD